MPDVTVDREGQGVERHLAAAAEYIKIAEADDVERSAYEHAADEIIAAQGDDPTLSNTEIARRVGKSRDWVRLLVQWRTTGDDVAPFGAQRQTQDRNVSGARTTARTRPDDFAQAFEDAPPEAKRQIAERISHTPEVRSEARKRDTEADQRQRPEPVPPRADRLMYEAEGKLDMAERGLRQFNAIISEIDQPGDDEDVVDQLGRIEKLVQIGREAYVSGKSVDTWALELYQEHERSSE